MVKIEGYSPEELLSLPAGDLDAFVFMGRPVVVKVGSAELLAECRRQGSTLIVDLAHIDGGGEGALPTLTAFLNRFAQDRGFAEIEWIVRATDCARPNERLQRILVRKGFSVRSVGARGDCYYKTTPVGTSDAV